MEKGRHLFGLGLLTDVGFWPICGQGAYDEYFRVLDRFGIGDVKFLGYWNNSALIGGQTGEVKASAYRKPKGGALIVVYNTTREAKTVTLQVDWETLKSKGVLSVVDAYTDKPVSTTGKSVTLYVPPLNHRLFWVK